MKSEAQSGFVNIVVFGYWYSMSYNDELRSSYIKWESKEEVQLCTDIQVGIQKCPVFRKNCKQNTNDDLDTWYSSLPPIDDENHSCTEKWLQECNALYMKDALDFRKKSDADSFN